MTPYEEARKVFAECGGELSFESVVAAHLDHGVVVSTPTMFALLRRVPSRVAPGWFYPELVWRREVCDCWYVHLFAGYVPRLWNLWPIQLEPLKWVQWHSRHHGRMRLHCHELAHICKLYEHRRISPRPDE